MLISSLFPSIQFKCALLIVLICALTVLTYETENKKSVSKQNKQSQSSKSVEEDGIKSSKQSDDLSKEDFASNMGNDEKDILDDMLDNDDIEPSESEDTEDYGDESVEGLLDKITKDYEYLKKQSLASSEIPRFEDDVDRSHNENSDSASTDEQHHETDTEEIKEDPYENMSEDDKKAEMLYQESVKILNESRSNSPGVKVAFQYLNEASDMGHTAATELLATGTMLGWGVTQSTDRAHLLFKKLAEMGSPRGQLGLGFLYATGLGGLNSSQAMALVYFTFGALGGDHFAQMMMGYRYWAGIGVEANCELALAYYKRVAEKVAGSLSISGGPAVHRIRLVEEVEQAGRQTDGTLLDQDLLQYYQFLADKGDVNAQIGLGQLYFQGGRGVEVNYEKALLYLKMAENAGNSNAMAYLGKMYLEGGSSSVTASNKTAFEYFKRSAELGNSIGLSGLGTMYLQGRGVKLDFTKALEYFSRAADQGWVEGQLQLAIMYSKGLGTRINHKLALKYFNLAAQQGNVLAFYNLAQMHAAGTGVLRSCHTATELFKNVAERGQWSELLMDAHTAYRQHKFKEALIKYLFLAELGYEVAQSNAAFLLDEGVDDLSLDQSENFKRALLQWQRSASQGFTTARVKVGDYHYYGFGTKKDYEAAAQQYRMASEQQRNPQAMFNLAYMHEQGLGMKRDFHLAKRFYDLAAESSSDAQVPVSLALAKLNLYFALEYVKDYNKIWNFFTSVVDPRYYFGPKWDLYLMTVLLGLAIIILFILRGTHRPPAQRI